MSEANHPEPHAWNSRSLTSLVVVLSFLMLATTGVVMYISPQGRVANWTGWNIWGLSKEQWAAVHTTAGLLFVLAAGFHVYFNWQTLFRYLARKRRLPLKPELIVAAAIVSAVFIGTVFEVPPFRNILALKSRIKGHWEGRSAPAPYPRAGAPTLSDFNESSAEISERRVPRGPGAGLGRQTLRSLCEINGVSLDKALEVLEQQGFAARAESTLKALGEQKGMSPAEVRDLLMEKNQ